MLRYETERSTSVRDQLVESRPSTIGPSTAASASPWRAALAAVSLVSVLGSLAVASLTGPSAKVLLMVSLAVPAFALSLSRARRPAQHSVLVVGGADLRNSVEAVASPMGRKVLHVKSPPDSGLQDVADLREVVVEVAASNGHSALPSGLKLGPYRLLFVQQGNRLPNLFGSPLALPARAFKRSVDLVLGSVALLLASPIILISIVAIRLESHGRAFFRQERVGIDGRIFRVLKLRTMIEGNDDSEHRAYTEALLRGRGLAHGGVFKLADDPRRTRVGQILRRTSIDELPQLWNVLRGEMSLVGPRPSLVREVELYTIKEWARLGVKPGVTGLWQVRGRSLLNFQEMVALDTEYCESWSPWLDLKILLLTPMAVLTGRGAV